MKGLMARRVHSRLLSLSRVFPVCASLAPIGSRHQFRSDVWIFRKVQTVPPSLGIINPAEGFLSKRRKRLGTEASLLRRAENDTG